MKTINALALRNNLGKILDTLEKKKEPILITKGRRLRAALVDIEDFKLRFLDRQAEEEKARFLQQMDSCVSEGIGGEDSLTILRRLRGYDD